MHHNGKGHKANVMLFLQATDADKADEYETAPSGKQFLLVWDRMCEGMSPSQGIDDIGAGEKISNMVWCIACGIKMLDRRHAKRCRISSMMRDERKPWLVVRFSMTDQDLLSRRGLFGMEQGHGTGSTAITKATQTLMVRFCTPEWGAPRKSKVGPGKLDTQLLEHLRQIQRQLIIDSASDERLSFRQMVEGMRCDGADILTPNQDIETLDHAHGTTRMLSRTFTADEYMNTALEKYITGRHAFVTVVHNSSDINDVFEKHVKEDGGNEQVKGLVRNLGFAKHRMASIKKRLGRFVGKFNATCATATWVRTVRPATKKEAVAATTLLAEIEEEEYTQLAMMADCSVEVGELVLFVDDEQADMTIMSAMAKRCLDRLKWLILERGLLKTGYTKFAVNLVERPRMFNVGKNKTRKSNNTQAAAINDRRSSRHQHTIEDRR